MSLREADRTLLSPVTITLPVASRPMETLRSLRSDFLAIRCRLKKMLQQLPLVRVGPPSDGTICISNRGECEGYIRCERQRNGKSAEQKRFLRTTRERPGAFAYGFGLNGRSLRADAPENFAAA